jgi:acyl carrier protein
LAFAIPDQALGEEVGAAVVLKPEVSVSEMQLCEYMAERIVDFKVPRRIVFLESLPLGPTGKPQRIGLASKLGIDSTKPKEMKQGSLAPRNEIERRVADIWREVLRKPTLGVLDNFFDLGGDSILAVQLTNRLAREFEVKISVPRLIQLATVAEIASWIDGLSSTNHEFSKTAGVI